MVTTEITLTARAADHISRYLKQHGGGVALRLGVKTTGCSGHQYVIEPAQDVTKKDCVFESNGVKIVVDNLSISYLAGTELDYVREGLQEGFRFSNPNVMETCGCGASFSVEDGSQ